METKPISQDSVGLPAQSPGAASQNGLIHAVKGLQLHAPLITQHLPSVPSSAELLLHVSAYFLNNFPCYLTLRRSVGIHL